MSKLWRFVLCIAVAGVVWSIPTEWMASWIPGLTIIEHRTLVIFVLAAFLWVLEPVPIFSTSILVLVLQLLFISDQGLAWLRNPQTPNLGPLLKYKSILGNFGSDIIWLFIGGFFLADAATKYRLDLNLARIFIRPFGKNPHGVLLGIMLVTAVFSMFMSNTATTAMMLAILTPILGSYPEGDKGKIAMCLAIPFAANIGGLGTPIGTPPNAIALKYLSGIQFVDWMAFAVPFVVVSLFASWFILIKMFPCKIKEINLDIQSKFQTNWRALAFYCTFIITVLLWILEFWHGMNSYVVAMIPIAVFTTTKIITAKEIQSMDWDVLWLLTGGLALGASLEQTGLAKHILSAIPFKTMSPYWIVFIATFVTFLLSNFMSHTAAANLLLPIMVLVGNLESLKSIGGLNMLVLVVTFTCSLAMTLPISTPPNAMAQASGRIESKDMFRSGLAIGFVGILLLYGFMYILFILNFFRQI